MLLITSLTVSNINLCSFRKCITTKRIMWMCMQFCHMVYKPWEKNRKKAIYWGLMITLDLIQSRLRALWFYVRVREGDMWGSLVGLHEWIFYVNPPAPSFSLSCCGCTVKGIQWYHCLPFSQALSLLCEVKNTKTSSKANSQNNVQFIWVKTHHTPNKNIFIPEAKEG